MRGKCGRLHMRCQEGLNTDVRNISSIRLACGIGCQKVTDARLHEPSLVAVHTAVEIAVLTALDIIIERKYSTAAPRGVCELI